jgi:DNA-binding response OmpR family regulator
MRILIAEDDYTSRVVLEGVLKKYGHQVTVAVNGLEAWQLLQHPDAPSLVILDWMMPEMDGFEVLKQVRTLPTNKPPYIIMLTAKGEKADIIAGLDAGANDYLSKPFDSGELRARVEVGCRMIDMQNALIESREILAHQANHDAVPRQAGVPDLIQTCR